MLFICRGVSADVMKMGTMNCRIQSFFNSLNVDTKVFVCCLFMKHYSSTKEKHNT